MGLETGIEDLEARIRVRGGTDGRTEKEKEKEKIPDMCESIGHPPLWDHCPKTNKGNQILQKAPERVCSGKYLCQILAFSVK